MGGSSGRQRSFLCSSFSSVLCTSDITAKEHVHKLDFFLSFKFKCCIFNFLGEGHKGGVRQGRTEK